MNTRWVGFLVAAAAALVLCGGCATATSAAREILDSALEPLQSSGAVKTDGDAETVAKKIAANAKATARKKQAEYDAWREAQKQTLEQIKMEREYNRKGVKTNFNKRPVLESFEQYQESKEPKKRSTRHRRHHNPTLNKNYR